VAEGGPADRAGVRGASPGDSGALTTGGDVTVRVGDRDIASPDDLAAAITDADSGLRVELTIVRGDQCRTVRLRLAHRR
jgi:S1-C subfamily serine protease